MDSEIIFSLHCWSCSKIGGWSLKDECFAFLAKIYTQIVGLVILILGYQGMNSAVLFGGNFQRGKKYHTRYILWKCVGAKRCRFFRRCFMGVCVIQDFDRQWVKTTMSLILMLISQTPNHINSTVPVILFDEKPRNFKSYINSVNLTAEHIEPGYWIMYNGHRKPIENRLKTYSKLFCCILVCGIRCFPMLYTLHFLPFFLILLDSLL